MEINYKGILCRLGTYRVNGEDKPALWYISSPDDKTMYKAGFEELHYGVLGKVLTDKEYKKIKKIIKKTEIENEINEELNSLSNELLYEMKKHKPKGTYRIIRNDTIEWKIQDDVTIMIFICATSSGEDDLIDFYYKDSNGNEHRYGKSDEYPHSNIMELLRNYNGYKFEK